MTYFSPAESPKDVTAFKRRFIQFAARHKKIVLQHSGGRDSIAVYKLLEPFLEHMTVVWLNSGDLFPEIVEYMRNTGKQTPNFVELQEDSAKVIADKGWPVDVLPIDYTHLGQRCTEQKPIKLRSYLDCCVENISLPMHQYVKSSGATLVIRGNRKIESHRTPIENGGIENGIQYVFPIWDWSDEEVLQYLEDCGEPVTPRLKIGHSSLDCQSCTAYVNHSQERMAYIKEYHPVVFHKLQGVFKEIKKAQQKESEGLDQILSM